MKLCIVCFNWICVIFGYQEKITNAYFENNVHFNKTKTPVDEQCDVNKSTGCETDYCCVYQVSIYRTRKITLQKRKRCKPLRNVGDLCLINPENQICPCRKELFCKAEPGDNFGHCQPNV